MRNKHIDAVLEIVKKTNRMKEIAANERSEFDGVQYYDYTDEYKRRKKQEINDRLAADPSPKLVSHFPRKHDAQLCRIGVLS